MKIGCDIVENNRFENIKDGFIKKVLTLNEIKLYEKKGMSFLMGRFAAKEAIMKCLPNTKSLSFLDIEVLIGKNGEPLTNIDRVSVSISHEKNYTIAVAIFCDD